MGRKAKISYEQKLSAIDEYLSNKGSLNQISRKYNVCQAALRQWLRKYKTFGCAGLIETHSNTNHSPEVKLCAVLDYLNGEGSQSDICIKYKMSSKSQLQKWVLKYNSHEKFKSSGLGGNTTMTKGRTTTFEERIEIVKHCIEQNRNYSETAIKYQVSYQQVRSWMVKYGESGVDSLTDRRGKRKSEEQLTELERLKAQNKLLEARNNRLEMENEVLKKLEEIERRWT